jgi:nitrate/nitrite transport system permease protein
VLLEQRAAGALFEEHQRERQKASEFDARQAERKAVFLREQPGQPWVERRYAGKPTFLDQIATSLATVFTGFVLAALVAVPLGILCGSSPLAYAAFGPFIQLFKPVSPLAWLPIVMILVSGLYNPTNPWFDKAFLSSAITVALCSLWPALINTALGVAAVDRDHLNVARVLRLGWWTRVTKIIVPSALPLIFTGLRLSLGVGWMVLIAAEMLAQNPGLGKFVWDMFQNGSSDTLAMIMVAVFTIGLIGFLLDRVMVALQQLVSFGRTPA